MIRVAIEPVRGRGESNRAPVKGCTFQGEGRLAVLEFLTAIASAAVTAIVHGLFKLFAGRRPKEETYVNVTTASQTVVVMGRETLAELHLPDSSRIREILQVPRGVEISAPRLLLPGEGIVSPGRFIDRSMDCLVTRSYESIQCSRCGQFRDWGAFATGGWKCVDCLGAHLSRVVHGGAEIVSRRRFSSNPWRQVEPMLVHTPGYMDIADDPTMNALLEAVPPVGPVGTVVEFWVETDVFDSKHDRSLLLHVTFDIFDAANEHVRVVAFFCSGSGEPLRDIDGRCTTRNGRVAHGSNWISIARNDSRQEGSIIMPYDQLHLEGGEHKIKCHVGVQSRELKRYLFWSEWRAVTVQI
jgi:hypothetical protein